MYEKINLSMAYWTEIDVEMGRTRGFNDAGVSTRVGTTVGPI
jgi:hypothetical protein